MGVVGIVKNDKSAPAPAPARSAAAVVAGGGAAATGTAAPDGPTEAGQFLRGAAWLLPAVADAAALEIVRARGEPAARAAAATAAEAVKSGSPVVDALRAAAGNEAAAARAAGALLGGLVASDGPRVCAVISGGVGSKKDPIAREGALLAAAATCMYGGHAVEPWAVTSFVPLLIDGFDDAKEVRCASRPPACAHPWLIAGLPRSCALAALLGLRSYARAAMLVRLRLTVPPAVPNPARPQEVRDAARMCAKEVGRTLSGRAVRQCMGCLYPALDSTAKPKVKMAALGVIAALCAQRPEGLEYELPDLIPLLIEALSDTCVPFFLLFLFLFPSILSKHALCYFLPTPALMCPAFSCGHAVCSSARFRAAVLPSPARAEGRRGVRWERRLRLLRRLWR